MRGADKIEIRCFVRTAHFTHNNSARSMKKLLIVAV